jgi:hypothetical protein
MKAELKKPDGVSAVAPCGGSVEGGILFCSVLDVVILVLVFLSMEGENVAALTDRIEMAESLTF